VAPLSSAHAESGDAHSTPHLTTTQGDGCPPAHDDLACQICRTASGFSGPVSTPVRFARDVVFRVDPFRASDHPPRSGRLCAPIGPRAPPSL
jgi:hypothetical protein